MNNTISWIVLPAFNEARALPGLVADLKAVSADLPGLRILVVDDGSSDGTAKAAQHAGADVVTHARNLGLGRALLTGFAAALSDPAAACVVTMDADGTAGAGVALALARAVLLGRGWDRGRVAALPAARVEGVPPLRRAASWAGSLVCRAALGLPTRDCTSGFRAYSASALRRALEAWDGDLVTASGPACQVELLWKCLPFAGRVAEVPLILDYGPKRGRSSTRLLRHSAEALALVARLRARGFLPKTGNAAARAWLGGR